MKRIGSESSVLLPYLLISVAAALRLAVSHPYNFIPVFSCILLFGACRPKREFPIPILALMGVDSFLTTHRYGYALTGDHAITWTWYLVVMILGAAMLGTTVSIPRILGVSLLASVSFFVVSNLAVWAAWGMYAKTLGGMEACYIAALPFFRNSIVTELVFSLLILGLSRYCAAFSPARRMQGTCS
jgi:hypothetical protein